MRQGLLNATVALVFKIRHGIIESYLIVIFVARPHKVLPRSIFTMTLHILHPSKVSHSLDHDSNNSDNNSNSGNNEPYDMSVFHYECEPSFLPIKRSHSIVRTRGYHSTAGKIRVVRR
jgi:hypothetical protein